MLSTLLFVSASWQAARHIDRALVIPHADELRYAKLAPKLSPGAKTKVEATADKVLIGLNQHSLSANWLQIFEKQTKETFRSTLSNASDADIAAVVFIVMMEAAKSSQDDLKSVMDSVAEINKRKDALRGMLKQVEAKLGPADSQVAEKNGSRPKGSLPKPSFTKHLHLPLYSFGPETKLPKNFGSMSKSQLQALEDDLKNKLDSESEMGETESLRLQMAMDRVSKFMQTLSNIEKKISDTSSAIVQNLK